VDQNGNQKIYMQDSEDNLHSIQSTDKPILNIQIDKNNKVLMKHWKYFGYKPLLSSLDFFEFCKQEFNIKLNYNLYYKKI
jgi:hypothetical protein